MFQVFKKWVNRIKDGPVDWDELEATLIQSDLGLELTDEIIETLKKRGLSAITAREELRNLLRELWDAPVNEPALKKGLTVWFVCGVNGVGKTSSIGKLAWRYQQRDQKVFLVGADTFRAAAGAQLKVWADKVGVGCHVGEEGSDPGAAAYQGIEDALAQKADLVLIDTAGRLHNKEGLMRELDKVKRVVSKKFPMPRMNLLSFLIARREPMP